MIYLSIWASTFEMLSSLRMGAAKLGVGSSASISRRYVSQLSKREVDAALAMLPDWKLEVKVSLRRNRAEMSCV